MTANPTAPELLPCPFCGYRLPLNEGLCKAEDGINPETEQREHPSGICCSGCAAYVVGGETDAEAITAWNTRPQPTAPDECREVDEEALKQIADEHGKITGHRAPHPAHTTRSREYYETAKPIIEEYLRESAKRHVPAGLREVEKEVCAKCGDELALTITERPDGKRLVYYSCDKEACNESR